MRCSLMRSSRFLLGVSLGEGGIGNGSSMAWRLKFWVDSYLSVIEDSEMKKEV